MRTKTRTAAVTLAAALMISGVAAPVAPISAAKSKKVYIAPLHGKKYHSYKSCRGLRRARSVKKVTIKYAKRCGYKKCKLC